MKEKSEVFSCFKRLKKNGQEANKIVYLISKI